MTITRSRRCAFRLLVRLAVAFRLAAVGELDTTISNVSPSTPIRGGTGPRGTSRAIGGL